MKQGKVKIPKFKIPKPLKPAKSSAYDPPPEKFVVVVHPWLDLPSPEDGIQKFCDTIGAWFECMLMSNHGPNTRILTVFHMYNQRQFIIVELPQHVNVEFILGSHSLEEFSTRPVRTRRTTFIYEYNYRRHGDPDRILRFDSAHPNYGYVDRSFPVKQDDYPSPAVPPPPDPLRNYPTLPISEEVLARIAARRAASMLAQHPPSGNESSFDSSHQKPPEASTSANGTDPSSAFTPYVLPSHLYPRPGGRIVDVGGNTQQSASRTKRDSFEEEEDTKASLYNRTDPGFVANVKSEPGIGVKREPGVKLEPGIKREPGLGVKLEPGLKSEPDMELASDVSPEMQNLYSEYSEFRRQQRNATDGATSSTPVPGPQGSGREQPSSSSRVKAESTDTRIKPELSEPEPAPSSETQALYDEWKEWRRENQSRPSPSSLPPSPPPAWRRQRERNADLVFASNSGLGSVSVKAENPPPRDYRSTDRSQYGTTSSSSAGRPVKHESESVDSTRTEIRGSSASSGDRGRYLTEGTKLRREREEDDRYIYGRDDRYKRYKRED